MEKVIASPHKCVESSTNFASPPGCLFQLGGQFGI